MRFAWTDDQLAFAAAARDVLVKEAEPWKALAALGVLDLLGELGLDELSAVPVLEETGRAALAGPVVETAMVAVPLGVAGRVATTDLGGSVVPWAEDADVFVLRRGDQLLAFERDQVAVEPLATVDPQRRSGRVEPAGEGTVLTDDPRAIDLAFDRGALGTAAQLCGLARAMLDMTVGYVTDRRQFGVPVGSFQAVKHHLADGALALEFARPAVARAAWSAAHREPTMRRDVSMAKALATDAAATVGRAALQCHGAIGYTVEHQLHLFLKRSWALARSWGDRAFHADRVGRAIGV